MAPKLTTGFRIKANIAAKIKAPKIPRSRYKNMTAIIAVAVKKSCLFVTMVLFFSIPGVNLVYYIILPSGIG